MCRGTVTLSDGVLSITGELKIHSRSFDTERCYYHLETFTENKSLWKWLAASWLIWPSDSLGLLSSRTPGSKRETVSLSPPRSLHRDHSSVRLPLHSLDLAVWKAASLNYSIGPVAILLPWHFQTLQIPTSKNPNRLLFLYSPGWLVLDNTFCYYIFTWSVFILKPSSFLLVFHYNL